MKLAGTLFEYDSARKLVAFETAPPQQGTCEGKFAIFVGGLCDGLLAVPYIGPLAEALNARGWSLVQPLLSSSYGGFGTRSLEDDADELLALLKHLSTKSVLRKAIFIGHSTGCQDIVTLFGKHGREVRELCGVSAVLQAPVSDREAMRGDPSTVAAVSRAADMRAAGNGSEIVPGWRYDGRVPVSADRLWSLCGARLTPDDLFSTRDTSDAELRERLQCMEAADRTLVLFSERDEYVADGHHQIALRITAAIPRGELVMIPGDVHAVESAAGISVLIASILSLL